MNTILSFLSAVSKFTLDNQDQEVIISTLYKRDYEKIISYIYRHKIHHLFFKHILDLELSFDMPYLIVNAISMQHSYLQLKHNEYMNEIAAISKRMEECQIPHVLLKGVGLANTLYYRGQEIFRDYNDIDFLVEKSNVKKVDEILQNANYIQGEVNKKQQIVKADRKTTIYYSLNSHQEQGYVKFSKYAIYSPYNRIYFDVNTTIFEGGKMAIPISTAELLQHTKKRADIIGNTYNALEHTYEFLQLCYHFYKDTVYYIKKAEKEDYCLIKFCDLREYILKYRKEIDWNEFISIVNQYKMGDKIYYTLFLISSFYGDLEIDEIMDKIESSQKMSSPNWDEILL